MNIDLDRLFPRAPWYRDLARLYLAEIAQGPSTGRLLWYTGKSVDGLHPVNGETAENGHDAVLRVLRDGDWIDPDVIVDETRGIRRPYTFASLREAVDQALEHSRLDPWIGAVPPMVWCESSTLANLLNDVTSQWGVVTVPFRGQASYGLLWELAREIRDGQQIFYLGDWNKAGTSIEDSGTKRVVEYANRQRLGWQITKTRLALTGAQVIADNLTIIPKLMKVNQHKKEWQDSVEIEALGRNRIIQLVEDAIKAEAKAQGVDLSATKAAEDTERADLARKLAP